LFLADPNPRLQLLIEAARRGDKMRLVLDGFFMVLPNRDIIPSLISCQSRCTTLPPSLTTLRRFGKVPEE
jgi:hypothetical protein